MQRKRDEERREIKRFSSRFLVRIPLIQALQTNPVKITIPNRMIQKQEIVDLVEQYLLESESESYLVDVTVSRDNKIVVEIDNDEAVDIDECAAISDYIDQHMDRDREDFELEVGSAGLTAPLKVLRQYQKFEGEEVEVLLRDGRKLKGFLGLTDEEGFDLRWTTLEKVTDPETGKQSKKKQEVQHEQHLLHKDVNQVKYIINF